MRFLQNVNYDFISKRKMAYIISGSLLLISFLSFIIRGFHFGIDFSGGSEVTLGFSKPVEINEIRNHLGNVGLGNVEVKSFGENGVLIRAEIQSIPDNILPRYISAIQSAIDGLFPGLPRRIVDSSKTEIVFELPNPDTTNAVVDALFRQGYRAGLASQEVNNTRMVVRVGVADMIEEILREKVANNKFTILREEQVGPKVGSELQRDAVIATFLSLVVILIYLGFRFKFAFALGAVVALFHDVIITLGLFSLLYGLIPALNLDITISIVAAILTLVGYSVNDTVIVFDRIREFIKIHKTAALADNMNKAISRTLSRTVITALTTLFTVSVLLIFGGEVLRGFAFALAFGILIGTYSSIFVATPFVFEYSQRSKKSVQF
ncbi:MAG: protein translocase subunit SecF [bacterium]